MLLACRVALASTPGRTLASAVQKPAELVGVCTRESSAVVPSAAKPATKGHTVPTSPDLRRLTLTILSQVRTETRATVRAQNLPHRCSYCLVVDAAQQHVLVQKRVAWKETYPSHFDPCPGGVMGPGETFEENAARELAEEMGIVTGSALAPQPPEPLFDFWFEDATIRNWGRLFKVTFEGDLADLSLQDEEVESVSWMGRAELARLLDTGPVCPDAALACRRWLASGEAGSP